MTLFHVREYDAVPTTNDMIKEAIRDGRAEGLVIAAFRQTAGYGRQGRVWQSPYGGMYASFLLRPKVAVEHLSTIALVVALAVRDALLEMLATRGASTDDVQVKWPNDVLCSQGKLCGISSELVHGALCVGIGINVFAPREPVEMPGKNKPAYVSDLLGIDRIDSSEALSSYERDIIREMRDRLVKMFEQRYLQWLTGGFAACVDDFRSCMALRGRAVEVTTRGGDYMASGRVAGVDDEGLLLLDDGGVVVKVASGEAHIASISC